MGYGVKLSVIYTGDNANVYLCMYIRIDNFISQKTHCIVLLSVHHHRIPNSGRGAYLIVFIVPYNYSSSNRGTPSFHSRTYVLGHV